ncbi:hypothetical protein Hanom_Chr10g00933451 [Helianthus anomalus]
MNCSLSLLYNRNHNNTYKQIDSCSFHSQFLQISSRIHECMHTSHKMVEVQCRYKLFRPPATDPYLQM